MRKIILPFAVFTSCFWSAQETDSTALISEVIIDAYKKPQKLISSTKSVSVSSAVTKQQNAPDRMLESINLLPGAKMEERSPGSYRLSVRGSTLRSPFGVRNIKIYLDDFVFSDAAGGSYLNVMDPGLIERTEIYKGPEGGDFGAVTGGTVLFQTNSRDEKSVELTGGSYGLFKEQIKYGDQLGNHNFQFFQSFSTTQSYREQSAMQRANFFVKDAWSYNDRNRLNFMLFYSNMDYETPGGLNFLQMQTNRKMARQATATLPGAVEQDAGIKTDFVIAGISHHAELNENWSHFAAFQSTFVGLKNPFITNYEKRQENNFALRTHLNYETASENWFLQSRLGFEGALNDAWIRNFDHDDRTIGNPQNFDDISTESGLVFFSQKANYRNKLFIDAAISINMMAYHWNRILPEQASGKINFGKKLLPDFGISYMIADGLSVRGKIGKGSSAPTLEEIRSSNQQINTELGPEFGWNKEIGIRKQFSNVLFAEVSAFDFRLQDAIVRQQDAGGNDYFVNAGSTVQRGLELMLETRKFNLNNPVLSAVQLMVSAHLYDFKYADYVKDGDDFSGNKIPGIGAKSFQGVVSAELFDRIHVDFANFYLPVFALNDANTVFSEETWLANLGFRYQFTLGKANAAVYFRINNLYNTKHVLGYDINAFGGRYYNPSAERNFSAGVSMRF